MSRVTTATTREPGVCPVGHDQKSGEPTDRYDPAYEWVERGDKQVLALHSFALGRAFLRVGSGTSQAGFSAEYVGGLVRKPLLYQEGADHRAQRKAIARFFTPRTVSERYRDMITRMSTQLITWSATQPVVALDRLSLRVAMRVVADVIGLTESKIDEMELRLDRFFEAKPSAEGPKIAYAVAQAQTLVQFGSFFLHDVRPVLRARRREPQDDLVSHLLAQGYSSTEVLSEAVMYAAAGMVTTRQFICMAAWHFLERPDLRAAFLAADSPERHRILAEIIRLEPVGTMLLRTAEEEIVVEHDGERIAIPAGTVVEVPIRATNADPRVFGEDSLDLRLDRSCPAGVPRSGLAFGDGHHSCPGEYLALHESEIFLVELLSRDVTLVQEPRIEFNEVARAYHLADFLITVR
ncbi:Cytochrome P450 [Nostocoides jenkinsii Ben 74]|uniref:Cytochrome P450 n=1 Tax=Nostocoides jenkinsii Ben 74 TaxID=1193518 RepID=A0A077M699_9MICO|nr:Cytochrome P450 [Tetrasphaera jenkinsii Ben 74]